MYFSKLSNTEIIRLYSDSIKALKQRGILRTNSDLIGTVSKAQALAQPYAGMESDTLQVTYF